MYVNICDGGFSMIFRKLGSYKRPFNVVLNNTTLQQPLRVMVSIVEKMMIT